MRFLRLVLLIAIQGILLSACAENSSETGIRKEYTAYSEQVEKVEQPLELELRGDFCNIESFSWDRDEIKIETIRRVRGTQEKAVLVKQLEEFSVSVKQQDKKHILAVDYNGSIDNPTDKQVDITLFLPRKIKSVCLNIGTGTLKFWDDIECSLDARFDTADMELNHFKGLLSITADTGNFYVAAGELYSGSFISTRLGNIIAKAGLEKEGNYGFETEHGNIDLELPYYTDFSLEHEGFLENCEFADLSGSAQVKAVSRFGRIDIGKN